MHVASLRFASMRAFVQWVLEGWPRPTKTKIHSEKFEIGTYIWCVRVAWAVESWTLAHAWRLLVGRAPCVGHHVGLEAVGHQAPQLQAVLSCTVKWSCGCAADGPGATARRRLLVIPGNDNQGEFLSVFLDSPEAPYTPAHLSPRAKFTLALESTLGREHDHKKGARRSGGVSLWAGGCILQRAIGDYALSVVQPPMALIWLIWKQI
jgi:hypothetical protein